MKQETTLSQIRQLADGTLTIQEIADCLMMSYGYIATCLCILRGQGFSIKTKRQPYTNTRGKTARNREIAKVIATGTVTLEALGEQYGVTRERIRQIAAKHGVTTRAGLVHKEENERKRAEKKAARELRRADRQALYETVRDLVADGLSIHQACIQAGLRRGQVLTVTKRMNLGAITRHGRWKWRYQEEVK